VNRSADVDAYIEAAPETVRPQLRDLRALIRAEAPQATEKMSYGIPFYEYGVKPGTFASRLIYFAAQKRHIALYPAGDARGLEQYLTERSTLCFPLGQPLPMEKIRALLRARVRDRAAAMKTQGAEAARASRSGGSAKRAAGSGSRRASRS